MRALLVAANKTLCGKPVSPLQRGLLKFNEGHVWTVSDSHLGTLVLGSPGRGKTTMSKTLSYAFLKRDFGALVSCVKKSAAREFLETVKIAGREKHVVVLSPSSGHRLNPFELLAHPADMAAMLGEVCDMVHASQGQNSGGGIDTYWVNQRDMLLHHLGVLARDVRGHVDAGLLKRLVDGLPHSRSETIDPVWREKSPLWNAVLAQDKLPSSRERTAAVAYLTEEFPALPEKTQGSVRSMVSGALHHLCQSPVADVFSGKSTVKISDVLNHRKLLVVDMPALDSLGGKVANLVALFCFCKAAKRIDRHTDAFLLIDECQELPCRELMTSLAVLRDRRVSTVMLTQNLGVLNAGLGKKHGENICELMETIIALGQSHADTREWLCRHIGKEWKYRTSYSTSDGKRGHTETKEEVDKVSATKFAELDVGESIVSFKKDHWRARWPAGERKSRLPIRVR